MSQNNPRRITGPAVEPITVAEAKEWAKVDGSADDAKITALIATCRQYLEQYLNRTLITTSWAYRKDGFPSASSTLEHVDGALMDGYSPTYEAEAKFYGVKPSDMVLPMGEIQSITSVKYVDRAGDEQTVDAADYFLGGSQYITPETGSQWPSNGLLRNRDAVEVVYVAGYGNSADDVPDDIKTALKMMVSDMYDDASCGGGMSATTARIVAPYHVRKMPIARARRLERS